MGLFDFAKNIGKKIFGGDDDEKEASAKLKQHIEEDNPGIENLQIDWDDATEIATLSISARSTDVDPFIVNDPVGDGRRRETLTTKVVMENLP